MSTSNQNKFGYETIPTELKQLKIWLTWRYVQKPGEPKPRKVPRYVSGTNRRGKQGTPKDRAALATFDAAVAAANRRGATEGVGLAMLADNGIVGLDFDDCIPELTGIINERVLPLIAGTYAEISPSGRGVRAFYRGTLSDGKKNKDADELKVEMFCSKGFLTVTGNQLPDAPLTIAPLSVAVCDYWVRRGGNTTTRDKSEAPAERPQPRGYSIEQIREDLKWVEVPADEGSWAAIMRAVCHETRGSEQGLNAIDEWSASDPATYGGREQIETRWRSPSWHDSKTPKTYAEVLQRRVSDPSRFPKATAEQEAALQKDLPLTVTYNFTPIPVSIFASGPEPEWIVKGVLPKAQMGVIFGAPSSGKSFFALDLAASIARGIPWRGRKTKRCRVLYICGESPAGFRQRCKAYAKEHGISLADMDIHLCILPNMPNLLEIKQVGAFIAQIKAAGSFDLIIIDTLSRAMAGGNENSGDIDGMGGAIKHAHQIHMATRAMILLIHHSGKDALRGARGWSGLLGQIDAEIEIARLNNGSIREATLNKERDAADGHKLQFTLDPVVVGVDEDGDPLTSLVVRPVEVVATATKLSLPTSINQRAVWDVLDAAQREMSADELITAAVEHLAYDTTKGRDRRREGIRCAIDRMRADGVLTGNGNMYGLHWAAVFPCAETPPQSKVDGIKVTSLAAVADTPTRAAINNRDDDDLAGNIHDH